MKIKINFIALFMLVVLSNTFNVKADSRGYIVKLKDITVPVELSKMLTEVNSEHRIYTADNINQLKPFAKYIEYTETNDEVMLIEGESEISLYSLPSDELYSEQWQLQMVNAEFAWDMETYGNEVNVAVIDTGCNPHEDINLAGGYNFILNNADYSDNHGHGTHVAGIISALHNEIGIAGVAPKVNIYALKCVDPYYSSGTDELIAAIIAAVDKYNCKVISMSLGVLRDDEENGLYEAVKYATDNGVVIVAAVGNDGNKSYYKSRLYYPAAFEEVIGVGSVGITKRRSYFSQQNNSVFVVAPGEQYKSTIGTDEYGIKSGTSQATPIVAAAAAILFSADYDMTLNEFKGYIKNCSEPLADEYCGYGLLNIEAMFKECIKNKDYYISPINSDSVIVYNNTDSTLNATGIFAEYEDKKYISGSISQITLLPDKKVKINCINTEGKLKFFLWNSMENLKPLTKVRIEGKER